jgi:hypothetical protein
MTMIAKKIRTYVSQGNLGLSQGEVHCSPGKVPFSLGNLGPSPKKNLLLHGEVVFFTKELFLFQEELTWDWHLIFFHLGKLFLSN